MHVDPVNACSAVFELLDRRLSPGEAGDARHMLHSRVRRWLWRDDEFEDPAVWNA